MTSGVGRIWPRVASQRRSWPRVVKYTGMPAVSRPMSASETWVLTVMLDRSAICTITGALWLAFRVWPCLADCDTTVPLIGA